MNYYGRIRSFNAFFRTFPLRKNQNLTIIMSENESLSYLLFHVLK